MRLVCWGVVFEIFVAGVAPMGWWVLLVVDVVFHCLGLTGALCRCCPRFFAEVYLVSAVQAFVCRVAVFFGRARTSGNGDIV